MKNPSAKKIVFTLVSGGLLGIAMSSVPVMASSMGMSNSHKSAMGQKANPCAGKMGSKKMANPCASKNPCAAKMGSKKMANPCASKNPCAAKKDSKKMANPCASKMH